MQAQAKLHRLFTIVFLSIVLASCAESMPSRYYLLTPKPSAEALGRTADAKQERLTVGFNSVQIPRYLDRQEIVTTSPTSQLSLAEFDKWGEPLHENIGRVVALNVARDLKTDRVFLLSERPPVKLDYLIDISIVEFDLNLNGKTSLLARWVIADGRDDRELMVGHSHLSNPIAGEQYGDAIDAMSRNLADLSAEITNGIRSLETR